MHFVSVFQYFKIIFHHLAHLIKKTLIDVYFHNFYQRYFLMMFEEATGQQSPHLLTPTH